MSATQDGGQGDAVEMTEVDSFQASPQNNSNNNNTASVRFVDDNGEDLGGLLNRGVDVRKVHAEEAGDADAEVLNAQIRGANREEIKEAREQARRKLRRKGAWRGIELSETASISFDHADRTFDFKIRSLVLGGELRVYIVFLAMFLIFFLVERSISDQFYYSRTWRDTLLGSEIAKIKVGRFFADIAEAADYNDWLCDVFIIQNIDPEYATGSSMFLGAFRVRTQRVTKSSCDINSAIIPPTMPKSAQECYGDWSDDHADKKSTDSAYNSVGKWKYTSCADMGGGSRTTGEIATYDCGGYHFEIPWWRPITGTPDIPFPSLYYERVPPDVTLNLYMAPVLYNDPPFIDNLATRFVTAEFFAYNPTVQNFFSFKLYAEVAAGGMWYTSYQARVFDIWTPNAAKIGKLVYDCFFYVFILYYLFRFIYDMILFYKKEGKLLAFFFDTWNLLEFANVTIFIVVIGYRIAWIAKSTSMSIDLGTLMYTQRYPVELDDILDLYAFQIYLNSVNNVLCFLKLLKFFRLNDRLNVLTRTLGGPQDSIIGVLLIFFLIVTAFAMTGHGLFGLGVWAFRSVDASYSTLLLTLVGQFDYQSMKNENRVLAGFFFWAYIILGLFCLLNFLIGVLMESFAEVSQSRTVLPLESVLIKTWEDFKRVCNYENITNTIKASLRGESKEELLQQQLDALKAYRLQCYPPSVDDLDDAEKQIITKPMYLAALPEELKEKIGAEYLDYVWHDLVYEWDQSEGAQEAIDAHRNLAMTARGVHKAIGKQMEVLESLPGRLNKLEQNLVRISQLLGDGPN